MGIWKKEFWKKKSHSYKNNRTGFNFLCLFLSRRHKSLQTKFPFYLLLFTLFTIIHKMLQVLGLDKNYI